MKIPLRNLDTGDTVWVEIDEGLGTAAVLNGAEDEDHQATDESTTVTEKATSRAESGLMEAAVEDEKEEQDEGGSPLDSPLSLSGDIQPAKRLEKKASFIRSNRNSRSERLSRTSDDSVTASVGAAHDVLELSLSSLGAVFDADVQRYLAEAKETDMSGLIDEMEYMNIKENPERLSSFITDVTKGAYFLKHGRQGKPHRRFVRVVMEWPWRIMYKVFIPKISFLFYICLFAILLFLFVCRFICSLLSIVAFFLFRVVRFGLVNRFCLLLFFCINFLFRWLVAFLEVVLLRFFSFVYLFAFMHFLWDINFSVGLSIRTIRSILSCCSSSY